MSGWGHEYYISLLLLSNVLLEISDAICNYNPCLYDIKYLLEEIVFDDITSTCILIAYLFSNLYIYMT